MSVVQYRDPFNAVLLDSPALLVTDEQDLYIREVLNTSCSDRQFAQKAYDAIHHILTAEPPVIPAITSLTPSTAAVGDASFTLQVMGTGFNPGSVIMFNGLNENTTFVSDTEVSTGVDMSVWLAAAVVPVNVMTNGVISDPMDFTFTDASGGLLTAKTEKKTGLFAAVQTKKEKDEEDARRKKAEDDAKVNHPHVTPPPVKPGHVDPNDFGKK